MADGKTKDKNYKNVGILWPKKTWRKIVGEPLWDGEKKQKIAGSMYVCMVITYSRVWINRVRLPILLVVS